MYQGLREKLLLLNINPASVEEEISRRKLHEQHQFLVILQL